MKVSIITQPLYRNYGGILQNFALQKVLVKMGHFPLTLNRTVEPPVHNPLWKESIKAFRNLYRKAVGIWPYPSLWNYKNAKLEYSIEQPQHKFISKYLNIVDVTPPFTQDVHEKHSADAYVVGSDQIWRLWCSPYIENCFLDFAKEKQVTKIAYAASFGTDNWEIDAWRTAQLAKLAKNFDAVSVREYSGVTICHENFGVTAKVMPDPTLLLDASDYLELTTETDYPHYPYIAAYILDINKEKLKKIKDVSKQRGIPVVIVGSMKSGMYDSIEKWLATLAHAEEVITDSFHGMVFSVIFEKKCTILKNNLRGNTRIKSLFKLLNLRQNENNSIVPDSKLSERRKYLQSIGIKFLQENLICH